MATEPTSRDGDIERLFSWLQTPDLHYREFASGREVSDTLVTRLGRPVSPIAEAVETAAEIVPATVPATVPAAMPVAPPSERSRIEEAVRPLARTVPSAPVPQPLRQEPAMIAPTPMAAPLPTTEGPFTLGAAGRGGTRPSTADTPAPPLGTSAPPARPSAAPEPATPEPATGGVRLFGGAAPESSAADPEASAASRDTAEAAVAEPQQPRPLDAVFGRLAGGGGRPSDPRERLRHIPGLGPPAGRSR